VVERSSNVTATRIGLADVSWIARRQVKDQRLCMWSEQLPDPHRYAYERSSGHFQILHAAKSAATGNRSRSCGRECSTAARVFAERGLPGRSASAAGLAWENFPASAVFGAAAPRMGALRSCRPSNQGMVGQLRNKSQPNDDKPKHHDQSELPALFHGESALTNSFNILTASSTTRSPVPGSA